MRVPVVLCLVALAGCSPSVPDSLSYPDKIAAERARKDEMFRGDLKESPIKPGEIDGFLPLSYFPIDEGYAVPAQLQPATARVSAQMPTSTGQTREMARLGTLVFT